MSARVSPAAAPRATGAAASPAQRWLFGPWIDLSLGCGAAYGLVFAALTLGGGSLRAALPYGVALLPISLVAGAHYGATALRAYERAEDRRAWWFFTLWTTLALGAAFVGGLASVTAGSWFITLYLTWSPWHYALQNFGVGMTFLRRRGIEVTPAARRMLRASFVLSFLLAAAALHASTARASYAPTALESGVYSFLPLGTILGVPPEATDVVLWTLGALWLGATGGAVVLLRRAAPVRDLLPALVLLAVQALWFSAPVLARQGGVLQGVEPLSVEHAAYAFLWIGAGHAVQYLWITAWFSRSSGQSSSHGLFVLKSLLAGTALWWVPAALFAPGLLGRLPYDAGLAAMVAALVNLHHFVLDGVIWKLRDGRIARVLLGGGSAPPATASAAPGAVSAPPEKPPVSAPPEKPPVSAPPAEPPVSAPPARPWVRVTLWTGGAAVLVGAVAVALLTEFGFRRPFDRGDLDAARAAADRLDRLGQASADLRLRLGQAYLDRGDLGTARLCLRRSVEILPTAWAWVGLGDTHARSQEWRDAAESYAKALEIEPDHLVATFHAAAVALELGQPDRALRGLERARALADRDPATPAALLASIEQVRADPRLGGGR